MSAIYAEAAAMWREMKDEYDAHVMASYWAAENATNGFMLNRAGRAEGISSLSLFTGHASRASKYASYELLEHWNHHPRPSLSLFESQWMAGRVVWA